MVSVDMADYPSSYLNISAEYIEKYKNWYAIPPENTDDDIRYALKNQLKEFLAIFIEKLNRDILSAINALPNKSKYLRNGEVINPTGIFPEKYYVKYIFKQRDNFLKSLIGEFPDSESYVNELDNEETAFYINCGSEICKYLASKVENHNNPGGQLQNLNSLLYRMKNDKGLLGKIEKGRKNGYVKFLSSSIKFLDIKVGRSNSSVPYSNYNQKNETNYVIPEKKILELHRILNETVLRSMDCANFMKCFDINNVPVEKPSYLKGQQNLMTFTLSLIKGIDEKIAFSNFAISNYYQMKNRPITKSKRLLQNKIENILSCDSISITSK